jgi:hypothetical protein
MRFDPIFMANALDDPYPDDAQYLLHEVPPMVEFDYYAAAELFPTRRRPSVSPSRTCRRNVSSAHFSKSMSRDTAATIFVVCTKAPNIL